MRVSCASLVQNKMIFQLVSVIMQLKGLSEGSKVLLGSVHNEGEFVLDLDIIRDSVNRAVVQVRLSIQEGKTIMVSVFTLIDGVCNLSLSLRDISQVSLWKYFAFVQLVSLW